MRVLAVVFAVLLGGCGVFSDGDDQEVTPLVPKSECDQYASQAVQTDDLQVAKNLAARASECYASLQNR